MYQLVYPDKDEEGGLSQPVFRLYLPEGLALRPGQKKRKHDAAAWLKWQQSMAW